MWLIDAVKVSAGAEYIATFQKSPESISHRQYCSQCGGHLMIYHPSMGLYDVMAATLPTLAFDPSVHIHYAESVLEIDDGLPKYRDMPAEF